MSVSVRLRQWLERAGLRRPALEPQAPALVIELVPIAAVILKPTPGGASPAAAPAPVALPALPALPKPERAAGSQWLEKFPTDVFAGRFAKWMSEHEDLADTDLILDELMHYAREFADYHQYECPSEMALTKAICAFRSGTPRPWKYATDRKIRKQHYRFPSPQAKAPARRRARADDQLSLLAA
jgi:hypothetical protein